MHWGIRKKLIIFLLLVTVLPFGASIFITYYQTTKSLNDQFVSTNYDLIVKGKESIVSYLDDVAQISTVLYRYTPFITIMQTGVSQDISNNQEEVRRVLAYLFNTRPEVEQMHLYIHEGKDSYTNYHSAISGRGTYEDIFSHSYYNQLRQYEGFSLIEPPHQIYSYNNLSGIPNSQKKKVISFHNIIRNIPSDELLGFLSIDINLSRINQIAVRAFTKDIEDLYIMNEKGVYIYSSNEAEIGTLNKEDWFGSVKNQSQLGKGLEWKDSHFSGVIVSEKFSAPYENWYIVKRIPYDVLYQGARETAFINILIGMITLVFVIFATLYVSLKITAPIKVLIANMKKVEKGEFEADFDSLGTDEIGMLGRHFKLMIEKINELILREYKLEIENKSSQLRVLHSQINPHFLYNALQSIGTLALKSGAVKVYSLLTSLSTIMRYSMNMTEDIVSIKAEIKHVQSYLSLQKQRFEEQFEFELNVEKEVEEILVPKMILQPIVENCFKHGFDQQLENASILIDVRLTNDDMVSIIVKDNGTGVSEDRLEAIKNALRSGKFAENSHREAIGLKNIYDRLQIYYDQQASIFVSGSVTGGFEVTIKIPKVMDQEVKHL
ncbi:sensor histidine kinase [Bacillus sp. MRMR6]|uniref:sensor histidine kinase n=1 Tax=Bacillus sp. MRMR6 TaxID=1928617 RepID=UPI0009535A94|nr:sensor histidine kinase [Bacillus sp. MRMR6]OLS40565.1 histidine kinase [Bacillus sp. MRMR6]